MRIISKAKKLDGEISISRVHGNSTSFVHIELIDKASGCILAEVEVEPEAFGNAVTGASMQPCKIEFYADCPVGKLREVKHEIVEVPSNYDRENAKKYLKPYEKDGWVGSVEDIGNYHHHIQGKGTKNGFRVSFIRFVDNSGIG